MRIGDNLPLWNNAGTFWIFGKCDDFISGILFSFSNPNRASFIVDLINCISPEAGDVDVDILTELLNCNAFQPVGVFHKGVSSGFGGG